MENIKPLPKPIFVAARQLGQVGAGKVVDFIPKDKKRWITLPQNARYFDQYSEFEVIGDSLEGIRIYAGYILVCRKNFTIQDIKPHKVCILLLPTGELTAKMIQLNGDDTVTVFGANPKYKPQNYFRDEVEILAVVDEVKWQI